MRLKNEEGLTLVELLVAITILGIIATAAIPLLSTCLDAHSQGNARSRLYQGGLLAMERMTDGVRRATYLLIPNAHNPTRDILAFSGYVNDDNDFYFGDSRFPRIDEDTGAEMSDDNEAGIIGVDDDGDGFVDEIVTEHGDDDEDGSAEEDPTNGYDDDGDGNIDEDGLHDSNDDNASGIAGMDDDGDGQVDNGNTDFDDDEDGLKNEDSLDPVVYTFDSATNTLKVSYIHEGQTVVISDHVTAFQVNYEAPEKILITLTLTGDDGESITFAEYVCPRNTFQRTGKRVN